MATLQIRKKSAKVWAHVISDGDTFILSKMYCKTDGDTFRIVEDGGSNRKEYDYSNITVYDDTDASTPETFLNSQALMLRLSALGYVGFSKDGEVVIADLISTDASNAIELGTDGKLFSSGGGGGSTLGLIKIVDKAGDFFTDLATASAYIRTFTSATITDESFSNGTFWFTVPNGSSFALDNFFLGDASVVKSAYIEDTLGIITTFGLSSFLKSSGNNILGNCIFGNNAFKQTIGNNILGNCTFGSDSFVSSIGNNILGNCTFGDNAFAESEGINQFRNILLSNPTNYFADYSLGRFEIYGNIGTDETANYANFFDGSTAVIWVHKSKETSNAGGIEGDLLTAQTNGAKLFFGYASSGSGSGGTLTREEFTFVSSQDFTLSYTPSGVYAVFVNGQELNSSQYSTATNVLTIIDTLESGDKVNIVYSASSIGVLDYYTKAEIDAFNYEQKHAEFIEVNSLADLPTQISGVITLVGGYTYLFLKHIDLLGSRLVCGQDTVIVGWSSENCSITSTGLSSSSALITSNYSLPIRNISFTHDKVFDLQGDGTTTALDWFGVNLLNCASGGTIKDYTNFVVGDSALLNSGGFIFDGTIGTIAFSNCLFDTASTKTAINVLSTCTISRRLRIIYSSFVVLSGETGINFNSSATVGDEKYILDTVNFSGGGTYIAGVDSTSNKALFANCVGITNTSTRGFMYMINNATDTTIGVPNVNVWVKAAGTTTAGSISKFTHANNRLTYTGAFSGSFLVTLNATARSSAANQSISIGVAKNGVMISESESIIRTTTANVEHSGSTQAVVELTTNDYIELYVRNTNSTDIRITDFNFNVIKIPV